MSDVDTGVVEAPETEAPVKEPLSADELAKRYDAARRDLREQRAEIRALREMIQQRPALAAEIRADEAEPDMDADPLGWMKYAKKELDSYKAERRTEAEKAKQAEASNNAVAQIARQMSDFERDFRADHPDYDDAATHFRKVRTEELSESGVSAAEINAALQRDLVEVVARAIRAGKDPADVVYKLAKNRGFGEKKAIDHDSKKLETIERAANAGKSLSQIGAQGGTGELTYEGVSRLKGKAFTDAWSKLRAQEREAEKRARRA